MIIQQETIYFTLKFTLVIIKYKQIFQTCKIKVVNIKKCADCLLPFEWSSN